MKKLITNVNYLMQNMKEVEKKIPVDPDVKRLGGIPLIILDENLKKDPIIKPIQTVDPNVFYSEMQSSPAKNKVTE